MSWDLFERLVESEVFKQSPFLCVSYLTYALPPPPPPNPGPAKPSPSSTDVSAQSPDANCACASCSRYAHNVGIHHYLCSKLRQFPYEEIEFFRTRPAPGYK